MEQAYANSSSGRRYGAGQFPEKGLESEHYAVDVSADGEQARAMAGELGFDLVVLDLNLPRMDGVAILRFLPACSRTTCRASFAFPAFSMR